MKTAVNTVLSIFDIGTSLCYWLLGRNLFEHEIKFIQELFLTVHKLPDESILMRRLACVPLGKDLLLVLNENNYNLVQWCVLNNYRNILTALLKYGCNPTRTGLPNTDLPLVLACCCGNIDIIKILLDYGANPSETTLLSSATLKNLSCGSNQKRYLKLMDLLKTQRAINSMNIALKFDDLIMFRLLMGDVDYFLHSSSASLLSMKYDNNDMNMKTSENDVDVFQNRFRHKNNLQSTWSRKQEDIVEQVNTIANDDLSDDVERGDMDFLTETTSPVVTHCDHTKILSEHDDLVEKTHGNDTYSPVETTDGGYYTIDGTSERAKSSNLKTSVHQQKPNDEQHIFVHSNNYIDDYRKRSHTISHTRYQSQFDNFSKNSSPSYRQSLLGHGHDHYFDQLSKYFHLTSFSSYNFLDSVNKHSSDVLNLLQQIMEHEAGTILQYFLNIYENELNEHFKKTIHQSDLQFKIFSLLSNIKSSSVYQALLSSNCTYFNQITMNVCDRENNTLIHTLLTQNPLKYQPSDMILLVKCYLEHGLNQFINRPNLSNFCMIHNLLSNEHFLTMIFFSQDCQLLSKSPCIDSNSAVTWTLTNDDNTIETWRRTYLTLLETLLEYGARVDISAGSYQNSIDCLLSTLTHLARCTSSKTRTPFDMKYFERLITTLVSSTNQMKDRFIYFQRNIERFLQFLHFIYIDYDDLCEAFSVISILSQYECQPLKLNQHTLANFFQAWIKNPNFFCSNLIGKDLFIQHVLIILMRQLVPSIRINNSLVSTSKEKLHKNLSSKTFAICQDNDINLKDLFSVLLNSLSLSQTCLQIQSIHKLIILYIMHAKYDIVNNDNQSFLPIVYLCTKVKVINYSLLIPFVDLFIRIHSSRMINRTTQALMQVPKSRRSSNLYDYFLSNGTSKRTVDSLRYLSGKCLYHRLKKPLIDSIARLPIDKALKERLINFRNI